MIHHFGIKCPSLKRDMVIYQPIFFIKMDISRGHFYKTIEEAEIAIKQYSKEHYFIRLIRL